MRFLGVKQSIFTFVFLQKKVENVYFISDDKYDRLKKDIEKNN